MILLDSQNQSIDIGNVAITKQVLSIVTGKIKGDFTINFDIDNNSVTRGILGIYGPNDRPNKALVKQTFSLTDEGNTISRGQVIINTVDEQKIHGYFISGNSQWFSIFDFNLKELEDEKYNQPFNEAGLADSTGQTDGLIFLMCDFLFAGQKQGVEYFTTYYVDRPITSDFKATDAFIDLYPGVYVHTLMTLAAERAGIKLAGNLMTDVFFNSLVIPPTNPNLYNTATFISRRESKINLLASQLIPPGVDTKINFNNEVYDGVNNLWNSSTQKFTADATYLLDYTFHIHSNIAGAFQIRFYKNGALLTNVALTGTDVIVRFGDAPYSYTQVSLVKGDTIEYYINVAGGATIFFDTSFAVSKPYDFVRPYSTDQIRVGAVAPDMSAFELFKWAIISLGVIPYYNTTAGILTLTKIESLSKENATDWSQYFVQKEDRYQDIHTNNFIRVSDVQDADIVAYNSINTTKYGEANIITTSEKKDETEIYTSPFGATKDIIGLNGTMHPNIPLVTFEDDVAYPYTVVTSSGGFADITAAGYNASNAGIIYRIQDDNGMYSGYVITTAGGLFAGLVYQNTSTGTVFSQKATKNDITPRILATKKQTLFSEFSTVPGGFIHIDTFTFIIMTFCWYSKPKNNFAVRRLRNGLNYGPINLPGYIDEPLQNSYLPKIATGLGNAIIRVRLLIPKSVFNSYDFSTFVYLKTKEVSGYFFPLGLNNFQPLVPMECDLFFIDD